MSIIDAPPTPGSPDGGRAAGLSEMRDRIVGLRDGFSARQRRTFVIVGVGVVVAVLGWSMLKPAPDLAPLYTNLDAEDAGVITKKLQETGVEYELTDGGTTIEVEKDVIYQTRADLAELELPGSGKVGYGILDDQGLTTSEFGQRVGFQRAMEGEIANTIEAMDGVSAATVHLALPPDSVFALDDEKPSASVMVKTSGSLDGEQVTAVVNLVASSIQGMEAASVSVSDAQGNVLAAPGTGVTAGGSGDGQEQSQAYENSLSSAIEEMLTAAVGPGKAKATVTADMDFSATTNTSETFEAPADPTGVAQPIPLDEEVKTETYGGGDAATQGVLGPTGTPTGATGTGSYSLNERTVRNAVNKVTETTQEAPGTVERLSVAVMVDETAVSPEQIADLQSLVGAAAGINTTRGDTLVVSRIAFDETVQKSMTAELEARQSEKKTDDSMMLMAGAAGAVLLALIIGFLLMRGRRKDRRELDALALEAAEMYDALGPGTASTNSEAVDLTYTDRPVSAISGDPTERRRDERRQVVSELIDNQPDEVAELLRGWLGDRRSVRR